MLFLKDLCLADHPEYEIDYAHVVDKMTEIQKLFRLSVSGDDAFEYFLNQSHDHKDTFTQISSAMKACLEGKFDTSSDRQHLPANPDHAQKASDKMSGFFFALTQMASTKGYSMIRFLNDNPRLGSYLESHILKLEAIYEAYQSFTGKKATARSPRRTLKTN